LTTLPEDTAPVAQLLEANKVIRSPPPPQPQRFPIEQYHSILTPHHNLFSFSLQIEQEAGHDTTKAQSSQGMKEHDPGWVTFKHPNGKNNTSMMAPNKETVLEYLSKGYTVQK